MFLLSILCQRALADDVLVVNYPEDMQAGANRRPSDMYMLELLTLALKNSGHPYTLTPIDVGAITESRSHIYLKSKRYNVHWLMTSAEHESFLTPIKIPLYKGLIGLRIFYILRNEISTFRRISTESELKNIYACQGNDWPDSIILKESGYRVRTSFASVGIFSMMRQGRCQYFPRSIIEIWDEFETASTNNAVVEGALAIHYPAAYYFFVSPGEDKISKAIDKGLRKSIVSGEFDKVFKKYYMNAITKANLSKRKIFNIPNTLFKNSEVLKYKELWLDPASFK